MAVIVYDSAGDYLASCTTIKDKIIALDAIIAILLTTAAEAAGGDNIKEYWLNDGQTLIKTTYKGTDQVLKSIESFEKLRVYYQRQLTGSVTRLVDGKNFTGNGSFR